MTATTEAKPWDFSHVLDLVKTLSHSQEESSPPYSTDHEPASRKNGAHSLANRSQAIDIVQNGTRKESSGLGDFSRIWKFLGTPASLPSTDAVAITANAPLARETPFVSVQDYASDSAVHSRLHLNRKTTTRAKPKENVVPEELSSTEDQAQDTLSDGSTAPDTPSLTKSQRKKRNRKLRREKDAVAAEAQAAVREAKDAAASFSEPEARRSQHKPPTKSAATRFVKTPEKPYNFRLRDVSGNAVCATEAKANGSVAKKNPSTAKKMSPTVKAAKEDDKAQDTTVFDDFVETPSQTQSVTALPVPASDSVPQHYPLVTPSKSATNGVVKPTNGASHRLLPSSVTPTARSARKPPANNHSTDYHNTLSATKHVNAIQPIIVRSGEDRHWALLMKLIGDFYEDRKHLISPMNLTTHNNDPNGIHVFVDASNIFIGFQDQLKISRGIPLNFQVPHVDLSFDALALLMERRRPVAKRVLVGSTPHLPAFDKAKAVGYECSILEKVYKARELTERQIYFKEVDRAKYLHRHGISGGAKAPPANNVATVTGKPGGGSGSGSETNTPQYAPARMIEQGVDEILHLKILESIVDSETPSTIVLATGDAARAEYSEGFMAMAERALKKGWTVELVSWSKNISAMYTRREWAAAWGERFRVVTLDDYAEELLDM